MRASRFFTLSVLVAATVASASVSQAQPRRARPVPPAGAPVPPPPPASHEEPIPPVAQAPGDVAPNAPMLLNRESEVRRGLGFQAFIDGELSIPSEVGAPGRGFTLNDAALYLSKDFGGGLGAMIDLPFASDDTTAAASNDITFGQRQAQAFFQFNRGSFQSKLGQFDTIYGLEQNDSKDRFFADAGLIKRNMIPLTHTGAVLGVGFPNFMVRALVANQTNEGNMVVENPSFGLQGRFDFAPMYLAIGALYQDSKSSTEEDLLIDLMGGFKADRFRLDVSVDHLKTPGVDDEALAIGVLGSFDMNQELALGARLEWANDLILGQFGQSGLSGLLGAPAAVDSALTLAVGPSWKWMPDVTLRGDVSMQAIDGTTIDDTFFGLNLSLVAGF